ncbi:MAG: DUF1059 domain-containing protein [Anaerolineae bacterium]
MTKAVHCRDIGFDCDGVVRAETEQEALARDVAQARTVHGLATVTEEVVEKVRHVMRDE